MNMHDNAHWEHGSDYHLVMHAEAERIANPWGPACRAYACGRDAFHALLRFGQRERGWKRLLVPSYYCQQVVRSFTHSGIALSIYPAAPDSGKADLDALAAGPGDVVLVVNFFGFGSKPDYRALRQQGAEVIEDHTHDPWSGWSCSSSADWCVASLRKTLPLPDGAMLWSPLAHRLMRQPELSARRANASARRLAAMCMKRLYIEGHALAKDDFRLLYTESEKALGTPESSAMTDWSRALLHTLPLRSLRQVRRANFGLLQEALREVRGIELLRPGRKESACPFACVLLLASPELRDRIREKLIARQIYPAVLWPLDQPVAEGVPPEHVALSRRLLSVHCDARYDEQDMERVAHALRTAARSAQRPGIHIVPRLSLC